MAFSCALITFDRGKPDGVFFEMKMSPGRVDSPRTYAVPCVWASHDRVKNRKSGSEPYLPLKTLDWIERGWCHLRRWQAPILSPFCFLDRRALVCSPSKKADYISGGLKRPLVFQEGSLRPFPQCVEIFKNTGMTSGKHYLWQCLW